MAAKTAFGKYLDPIRVYDYSPKLWDFVLLTLILFYVIKRAFLTAHAMRAKTLGTTGTEDHKKTDNVLSFLIALVMAIGLMRFGKVSMQFAFTSGILPGFAAAILGFGAYNTLLGMMGKERWPIAMGIAAVIGIGVFAALRSAAGGDYEWMYILFWFVGIMIFVSLAKGSSAGTAQAEGTGNVAQSARSAGAAADRLSNSVTGAMGDVGEAASAEDKALQNARQGLNLAQQLTGETVSDAMVTDANSAFMATLSSYRKFADKLKLISTKLGDARTMRIAVENEERNALTEFNKLSTTGKHAREIRSLHVDFKSKCDAFNQHIDAIFSIVGTENAAITAFNSDLTTKLAALEIKLKEFETLMGTLRGAKGLAKKIGSAGIQPAVRKSQLQNLGKELYMQLNELIASSEVKAGNLKHLHDMLAGLPQIVRAHRQYLDGFNAEVTRLGAEITAAGTSEAATNTAITSREAFIRSFPLAANNANTFAGLLTSPSGLTAKAAPELQTWFAADYKALFDAMGIARINVDKAVTDINAFITNARAASASPALISLSSVMSGELDSLKSLVDNIQTEIPNPTGTPTSGITNYFEDLNTLPSTMPTKPLEDKIKAWIARMGGQAADIKNRVTELKTHMSSLSTLDVRPGVPPVTP